MLRCQFVPGTMKKRQRRRWRAIALSLALAIPLAAVSIKARIDADLGSLRELISSKGKDLSSTIQPSGQDERKAEGDPSTNRPVPVDRLVRDATSWAQQLQLNIASLRIQHSASGGDPGSVTVQAELEGKYADIKTWLAELLGRYSQLAVLSMNIQRRSTGDSIVSAQIRLQVLDTASSAPGAGSPVRP